MRAEIVSACDHAISALANGCYQGIGLTILVWLLLRFSGRSNAATRHSVWMATLLLLPCIIAAHYWLDRPSQPRHQHQQFDTLRVPASDETLTQVLFHHPVVQVESSKSTELPAVSVSGFAAGTGAESQGPGNSSVAISPPVPWDETISSDPTSHAQLPSSPLPPAVRTASSRGELHLPVAWLSSLGDALRRANFYVTEPVYWTLSSVGQRRLAGATILGIWLCVACAKLFRVIWQLDQVRRLKRDSVPADAPLASLFHDLRARLVLKRKVELRVSSAHRSPVVLGFVNPVVLLPPVEILPVDLADTEQILRHELAHVRRGDDWANLIQHVIQALLFFHPGVWWASRQLTLEREIACDDQVLHGGGRPKTYALILANLASRMKQWHPALAPGASTNKSQLQQRINMILDTKRNASPRLAKTRLGFITSTAALLAVLAVYSGPRLALAESPRPGADNAPSPGAGVALAGATPEASALPPGTPAANSAPPEAPEVAVSVEDDGGPRYKSDAAPVAPVPPSANIPLPATPLPPAAVVLPNPAGLPAPVAAPGAVLVAPVPGPRGFAFAASGHGGDDSSLERRLERVEKMVQSLMAQQNAAPGHPGPKAPEWNWNMDEKQMARMKEMAEREKERAQQEAKRANEEFKRAAKEMDKAMKEHSDLARGQQGNAQRQLEALRHARENLERQMEKLDSQIEKLEQEQQKMQDDQERRSELQQEQKEAQEAAVAEAATE